VAVKTWDHTAQLVKKKIGEPMVQLQGNIRHIKLNQDGGMALSQCTE